MTLPGHLHDYSQHAGDEEWARSSIDGVRQELQALWAGTPRRIRRRRDVWVLRQQVDDRAADRGLTLDLAECVDDLAECVERPDDIGSVVFWTRYFVALVSQLVEWAAEDARLLLLDEILVHLDDGGLVEDLLRRHRERAVEPPGHDASVSPLAAHAPPASIAAPLSAGELVAA